jgi:hypothetical protein
MVRLFVAPIFIALFVPVSGVDTRNPLAKVIQMISQLQQKIIQEGEVAQKTYAEFAEWCEDESKNLRFEIKTAKAEVEQLKATIEKAASDIETEETMVEELSAKISTDEADLKAATEIRMKEKKDFEAEEKELLDTVDSLERAIMVLERELKGGASFVQIRDTTLNLVNTLGLLVESAGISSKSKSKLIALVQNQQTSKDKDEEDDQDERALDGDQDTQKKGGADAIIETLNDLLDKGESELAEARKKREEAPVQLRHDQATVDGLCQLRK